MYIIEMSDVLLFTRSLIVQSLLSITFSSLSLLKARCKAMKCKYIEQIMGASYTMKDIGAARCEAAKGTPRTFEYGNREMYESW